MILFRKVLCKCNGDFFLYLLLQSTRYIRQHNDFCIPILLFTTLSIFVIALNNPCKIN